MTIFTSQVLRWLLARAQFYSSGRDIILAQYIPAKATYDGVTLSLQQRFGRHDTASIDRKVFALAIAQAEPSRFVLRLRVPRWAEGFEVKLDGEPVQAAVRDGFFISEREWGIKHEITVSFRWPVKSVPLSETDDRRAILWGTGRLDEAREP